MRRVLVIGAVVAACLRCASYPLTDDAGNLDAGNLDAGNLDAGNLDAGHVEEADAGPQITTVWMWSSDAGLVKVLMPDSERRKMLFGASGPYFICDSRGNCGTGAQFGSNICDAGQFSVGFDGGNNICMPAPAGGGAFNSTCGAHQAIEQLGNGADGGGCAAICDPSGIGCVQANYMGTDGGQGTGNYEIFGDITVTGETTLYAQNATPFVTCATQSHGPYCGFGNNLAGDLVCDPNFHTCVTLAGAPISIYLNQQYNGNSGNLNNVQSGSILGAEFVVSMNPDAGQEDFVVANYSAVAMQSGNSFNSDGELVGAWGEADWWGTGAANGGLVGVQGQVNIQKGSAAYGVGLMGECQALGDGGSTPLCIGVGGQGGAAGTGSVGTLAEVYALVPTGGSLQTVMGVGSDEMSGGQNNYDVSAGCGIGNSPDGNYAFYGCSTRPYNMGATVSVANGDNAFRPTIVNDVNNGAAQQFDVQTCTISGSTCSVTFHNAFSATPICSCTPTWVDTADNCEIQTVNTSTVTVKRSAGDFTIANVFCYGAR